MIKSLKKSKDFIQNHHTLKGKVNFSLRKWNNSMFHSQIRIYKHLTFILLTFIFHPNHLIHKYFLCVCLQLNIAIRLVINSKNYFYWILFDLRIYLDFLSLKMNFLGWWGGICVWLRVISHQSDRCFNLDKNFFGPINKTFSVTLIPCKDLSLFNQTIIIHINY